MKYFIQTGLFLAGLLIIQLFTSFSWSVIPPVKTPTEDDYYKIITLPTTEGMLLEVGGITTLQDGRLALCTRRGDVYLVENPEMSNGTLPRYKLFASGLHEPLGLASKDNALYAAQRGELTKLMDTNGDDVADVY